MIIGVIRKIKIKYTFDLYNNIVLNKFVHRNKYKNSTLFTIYK